MEPHAPNETIKPSRLRRLIRWVVLLGMVLGASVALAGFVGWIWFSQTILAGLPNDLTEYRDWTPLTNVTVLDSEGNEADRFYAERREWVSLDTLPDHVWQAFVASEDKRFFEHAGVDALGVARALVNNAMSGETQSGASTLTQQLVKNLLVGDERTYTRKLKEAVLAYRLERDVGKDRILELYINYIALGSGNYGVEAASKDYFGVEAAQLDKGQAALLAGLVPAPSRYSPRRDPDLAKQRRELVLGRMVRAGYLEAEEAAPLYDAPVVVGKRQDTVTEAQAAYLTEVRREIRRTFGTEAPFRGGFTVHTPMRPALQRATVQAVQDAIDNHLARQGPKSLLEPGDAPASEKPCFPAKAVWEGRTLMAKAGKASWEVVDPNVSVYTDNGPRPLRGLLRKDSRIRVCLAEEGTVAVEVAPWAEAAAVVLHHPTGEVVAISGGSEVALEGFNRATQARRQPGSSFKPYVYAAALESGKNQLSSMVDSPLVLGDWSPKNYSGGYSGSMTLRSALARSVNTIAVRLTLAEGAGTVANLARDLGVRTPIRHEPSIGLGSSEVTPLDQAVAYGALLRGGVPIEAVWVRRIETADDGPTANAGEQLGDDGIRLAGAPGNRALRPETSYQVVDMLREVVRAGTARRAYDPERDRGGKTGTTNDFVDAWFVGFTAEHVIAVWVGTDGVSTLGNKETGGRAALPAWIAIAEALEEEAGAMVAPPPEIGWKDYGATRVALPWADH